MCVCMQSACKWPACADASREGTRPARCAGVGSDARVCVPNATPASEGGSWSESVGSCDILYACMGCAVERELCSPPLGGQTGYAARRSAGRRQAQRVLARGEMSGAAAGGSGMSGAAVPCSRNEFCGDSSARAVVPSNLSQSNVGVRFAHWA